MSSDINKTLLKEEQKRILTALEPYLKGCGSQVWIVGKRAEKQIAAGGIELLVLIPKESFGAIQKAKKLIDASLFENLKIKDVNMHLSILEDSEKDSFVKHSMSHAALLQDWSVLRNAS